MPFSKVRSASSRALAASLVCALAASAQTPGPQPSLKIVVLEGDGAINNIRLRSAKAPVVRVENQEGKPVSGAAVTFVAPDIGAGADFADRGSSITVVTGPDGMAVARGLRPNNVAGPFQIHVTAARGGATATADIHQTNVAPAPSRSGSRKKFAIIGIAAAGALGAGLALMGRGNSGSSSPGPAAVISTGPSGTTIAPGSPVFGPPR